MPAVDARLRRAEPWLWFLGAFLLVLGSKLRLVAGFASSTPFYDQWIGEAQGLFLPYMRGTLDLPDLLSPHNEHRILTARLAFLALLELQGGWSPLLEIIVCALLAVATVSLLVYLSRRAIDRTAAPFLAVAAVPILALPLGYENLIWGFQICYFLFMLSGIAGVALLSDTAPLQSRWWIGLAACLAAYLSLSSGVAAPLAAAAVLFLQALLGTRERTGQLWLGLALLALLIGFCLLMTPRVPRHDVLRAHGLMDVIRAFTWIGGTPFRLSLAYPLFLQLPTALLAWRVVRERPSKDDPAWRLLAIGLFLFITMASAAIYRTKAPLASRYLDFATTSLLLNLIILCYLARRPSSLDVLRTRWLHLWAAVAIAFVPLLAAWRSFDLVPEFSATRQAEGQIVAEIIRTGQPAPLLSDDRMLPARTLAEPAIRGLLPREFGAPEAERIAARSRLALGGGLDATTPRLLQLCKFAGAAFLCLGTMLLTLLGLRRNHIFKPTG